MESPLARKCGPVPGFFVDTQVPGGRSDNAGFLTFSSGRLGARSNTVRLGHRFRGHLFSHSALLLYRCSIGFLCVISLCKEGGGDTRAT